VNNCNELKGRYSRWRRGLQRILIERIVLRKRAVRDVVLAQLSAHGHYLYCEVPQGAFFVDPGDQSVGRDLLLKGGWESELFGRAVTILTRVGRFKTGGTFVNIGANIGVHVVSALRSGYFARAVAFEPEPANAALLVRNIAANALTDRVIVERVALGDAIGEAELRLHPRNKGAHSLQRWPSGDGRESVRVPVKRADAELARLDVAPGDIALILIDVEGYELEVVAGLGALLSRKIPLAVEFSPERYTTAARASLVERLAEHYVQYCALNDRDADPRPVSALAKIDRVTDVLIY
jgi:FkbM family methyltransferase